MFLTLHLRWCFGARCFSITAVVVSCVGVRFGAMGGWFLRVLGREPLFRVLALGRRVGKTEALA